MMSKADFRLMMKIIGTLVLAGQYVVYGSSIELAVAHGTLAYCIWFNAERTS